jgi:hypothetical protein
MGQDIYFHPGEFSPGTPEGDQLIAHELAHTLQTRQTSNPVGDSPHSISKPSDALEKNADALARGETSHALNAPAGAALRSPFDNESADDSARRQQLIQTIQNAEANLIRLLQTGGLIRTDEVAVVRAGVSGVIVPAATAGRSDENFVSYSDREFMIRRIIRSLIEMADYYRTNPMPGELPAATLDPREAPDSPDTFSTTITTPYGNSSYGGVHISWSQLSAAYELHLISKGMSSLDYWFDDTYLIPDYTIVPGAARGAHRLSRGIQSGAYMVFPDVENDPHNYWRLDGYTAVPRGAQIIEFWHDDIGYYYMLHDQRIDVPSPWR